MNNVKITRLDRRHNGFGTFTHKVNPTTFGSTILTLDEKLELYHQWRTWAWETFGPSCERAIIKRVFKDPTTVKWAWEMDNASGDSLLYFTDDAFTLFKLRWC